MYIPVKIFINIFSLVNTSSNADRIFSSINKAFIIIIIIIINGSIIHLQKVMKLSNKVYKSTKMKLLKTSLIDHELSKINTSSIGIYVHTDKAI